MTIGDWDSIVQVTHHIKHIQTSYNFCFNQHPLESRNVTQTYILHSTDTESCQVLLLVG